MIGLEKKVAKMIEKILAYVIYFVIAFLTTAVVFWIIELIKDREKGAEDD